MMTGRASAARGGLELEEKIEDPWWLITLRKKASPQFAAPRFRGIPVSRGDIAPDCWPTENTEHTER